MTIEDSAVTGECYSGTCAVCGKKAVLTRTYFNYDFKCDCHSPNHFELVDHCATCVPNTPKATLVTVTPRREQR